YTINGCRMGPWQGGGPRGAATPRGPGPTAQGGQSDGYCPYSPPPRPPPRTARGTWCPPPTPPRPLCPCRLPRRCRSPTRRAGRQVDGLVFVDDGRAGGEPHPCTWPPPPALPAP